MGKMPDGSVISSYFGLKKQDTGQDVKNLGTRTLIGQISKIHFVDDQTNISKKFVEYDVVIRDEKGGQSTFSNVRHETSLGGANDFSETILEHNEVAFSGKLDSSNIYANKNGTLVYVSFRDGSLDKPYIEGTVPHPKREGARRADGIRKLGEYRGVSWNINSLGELIITYNGNRNPNGTLVRADTGPTQIKIDKNGVFSISDNQSQRVEVNRVNKTISFSNGVVVTIDGTNDKFSVATTGGASVTVDGAADKIDALTAAGANISIDGAGDTVLLKDNASGSIKITGETIAIGASSAELLQQISDTLDKIITWTNNVGALHTHLGNLGYPTLLPVETAGYLQLGTELTTIKGLVDGIKGTL